MFLISFTLSSFLHLTSFFLLLCCNLFGVVENYISVYFIAFLFVFVFFVVSVSVIQLFFAAQIPSDVLQQFIWRRQRNFNVTMSLLKAMTVNPQV